MKTRSPLASPRRPAAGTRRGRQATKPQAPRRPRGTTPARKPANANHRSALPGPDDITRVVLSNGIVILARTNFNSPSVVIGGYLQSGSLFDPDEKLGMADFTAMALMRGTARHSLQEIFDALESVGANLSLSAGVHTAGFTGRSLSEDLPLLLGTLAEALRQPTFPPEQVEKLRAQLLTGLAIRAQDTADMASLTFDQIIYAKHPYARPEDGWPGERGRVTRLVEERIASVKNLAAYLCGNSGMLNDVTAILQKKGLCPIYREKYYDDTGEPE